MIIRCISINVKDFNDGFASLNPSYKSLRKEVNMVEITEQMFLSHIQATPAKSIEEINLLAMARYGYQDSQSETGEIPQGCLACYQGSKGLLVLCPVRPSSSENGK